jgi:plasmid segregation protein ParM
VAKAINPLDVVVGVDIGRSGAKISFMFSGEVQEKFIPSVVAVAKKLTFDANQYQTKEDTVVVDGQEYFVGVTAIEQGAKQTVGLSNNWLDGVDHRALLLRSKRLLESYGVVPRLVVVGLPVQTFQSHLEVLNKQVNEVFNCNVLAVPQPWGVYQDQILTDKGLVKKASVTALQEKIAVIDVGHYTTDIMLMSGQTWIQEASGSSVGVYKAIDQLRDTLTENGINASTLECQELIIKKKIKEYGQLRDISELVNSSLPATVNEVVQSARNLLESHARSIDHIYVAGGGAAAVYEELVKLWPQTKLAENSRFAIVNGMRKYGVMLAINDPKQLG